MDERINLKSRFVKTILYAFSFEFSWSHPGVMFEPFIKILYGGKTGFFGDIFDRQVRAF
jgi:hypothetical protein